MTVQDREQITGAELTMPATTKKERADVFDDSTKQRTSDGGKIDVTALTKDRG